MTLPFFIIGCGAKKADKACPASELYRGPLFKASLAYARFWAPDDRILILSALHGLMPLDRVIEPYEQALCAVSPVRLMALVARQIDEQIPQMLFASDITLLAGSSYAELLGASWLTARMTPPHFKRPLARLGIGQQIQWLRREAEEVTP